MSQKLRLTLACGDYESVRALKEGTVQPDGIKLNVLTQMDSSTRHWRFLRKREFDVAELSSSSYLLARDAGQPVAAIPVFLHRRFRHGFIFINLNKGIREPKDLIGRRVGVKSWQVSAILWMRGILEHYYGVPHKSIEWLSEIDEDVDFVRPPDLKLSRIGESQSLQKMLVDGEIDAMLSPDLIDPIRERNPNVGRLFPNYKEEELSFYKSTGIFPIMHVMGLKRELVEKYPWVPVNLYRAFNESKAIAMKRMENPRIAPLAWYREAWEEQQEILGPDPWVYGLGGKNRENLETIVRYSHEQGMIKRPMPLEELFLDVTEGRKRGNLRI